MADIKKIKVGGTTYNIKDDTKLPKVTYEWNKEFAAGSNGAISLGRYNIYDSQLTFDITSTTNQSLSGKLVIATQNGTIHQAKVFGDASGALVSKLIIYQSAISNSRSWVEVFCNFNGWSKNKVHIYAIALNSATVQKQMTSVTISNGVPAAANVTSGDTKWTGAIVNDFNHSHGISIATSSGKNQLNLAHGTKYALTAGGQSFIFTTPSDTNTSHSHSAGVGLVGSGSAGTSGTYTYKAKLRSETALTVDSAAATTTSGRVYPVAVDKSGYLSVNVPWTDTNTHYTNYLQIKGNGTEAVKFTQNADKSLNLKPGTNVSISAASGEITISATDTTYSAATQSAAGLMSAADKVKLDNIENGAEVNVQADWKQADKNADDYIKNKPTFGTAAGNIPVLDNNGKLADSVIPAVAITDTYVVDTETAMLALSAQKGDIAIRSDLNKSFVLQSTPASTLANWKELLTPTDAVLSVNGKTGTVTLNLDDINDGSTRKLSGYVTGPSSSTTNAVPRYTDATGKILKDSGVTISDANVLSATQLATNIIETGTGDNNYFQSRKFRGEGNAATYYHAVDFGFAGHNQVDFYEYGGLWNFWKNTDAAATTADSNLCLQIGDTYVKNKNNTFIWPTTGGTLALTSNIPTAATAADNILHGSNNGMQITYAPYAAQQSKLSFDTSTTAPTRTDRLNLNGYLYATKFNVAGKAAVQYNSTEDCIEFIFA